ncbi:hypothetical protein E2C01_059238 [Portunus trituberculatus]|uniref:Uncharacterized protein n=1 Tax=Portunus trituberculatus TaxID=210409 RepID=A0A5B7GYM1_PORTR|nr:hypothetical protein [Portunus trituberculatus]
MYCSLWGFEVLGPFSGRELLCSSHFSGFVPLSWDISAALTSGHGLRLLLPPPCHLGSSPSPPPPSIGTQLFTQASLVGSEGEGQLADGVTVDPPIGFLLLVWGLVLVLLVPPFPGR